MEKTYRIKIVRDGLEFEAEGDKSFVLAMLDRFEKPAAKIDLHSEEAAKPRKTIHPTETGKGQKATSVGEFIRSGGITKHVDTVLAFGYYLEKFASVSAFTPADINNCYYEAKMEGSNTSQMIIMNIRRGYLMEAKAEKGEGRRKYTLTSTGEKFVEELIQQNQHAK